jgi:hypothetical protein
MDLDPAIFVRRQQKNNLKIIFKRKKIQKKSQHSRNQGFLTIFA